MEARNQMKIDQMKEMVAVTIFSGTERTYHHQDMINYRVMEGLGIHWV